MFGMELGLYLKLSAMMFLEFAVWGAWYPVLATRLLGPLKFSGKQTGWIYAALPLGCIFMPLVAGLGLTLLMLGAITILRFRLTGTWEGFSAGMFG